MSEGYIERKYKEFICKHGYIPKIFNVYDCAEVKDFAPTLTARCESPTTRGGILIIEVDKILNNGIKI